MLKRYFSTSGENKLNMISDILPNNIKVNAKPKSPLRVECSKTPQIKGNVVPFWGKDRILPYIMRVACILEKKH